MKKLVSKISKSLSLNEKYAQNAVHLLFDEDCSIPFVARYRKEMTGSMDEVSLRSLRDKFSYLKELEVLKERYIKVINEHAASKPEVKQQLPILLKKIEQTESKQELEDIYLPFKPKRVTKAQKYRQKGLEPLVDLILSSAEQQETLDQIFEAFKKIRTEQKSDELSQEESFEGAMYILSERLSEDAEIKKTIRQLSLETGFLEASPKQDPETVEEEKERKLYDKYKNYFSYSEPLLKAVSHRIMALRRGESEKVLRLKISVDKEQILDKLHTTVTGGKKYNSEVDSWLHNCLKDAYTRLIGPSIETELRLELRKKAEEDAVGVFSRNLEKLLMLPVIPEQVVMGIDPGIRTGSKIAVISKTGKLLAYTTVYPNIKDTSATATKDAMETIATLLSKFNVSHISIGNGTGGRDIEKIVKKLLHDKKLTKKIRHVLVNESGASVYSVEPIAIEEFPDLDPTIRSAVSIARRLQDPLAELVKIEPRSIGVGQYQHDCNALKLNDSLKDVVESCVNKVGVNLNTSSYKLLGYVSGIGPSLGKKITEHRNEKGPFASRKDLLEVSGFGDKTFQQAAGFLRVPGSSHPLDNTGVHPERYELVERIVKDQNLSLQELLENKDKIDTIPWASYADEKVGEPTLNDIKNELKNPGRDPRKSGASIAFSQGIDSFEDLKLDMKLKGTVSNVTNFGAFVDIGIHQDGLVHISELTDEFVSDPSKVVSIGDVLNVRVIGIDLQRKRISLTCRNYDKQAVAAKTPEQPKPQSNYQRRPPNSFDNKQASGRRKPFANTRPQQNSNRAGLNNDKNRKPRDQKKHSLGDLLDKFNARG